MRCASITFNKMETKIKSKTIKNRFIYADYFENKKAKSVVIFLSSFSGSRYLPLFNNSCKFFYMNGFSTVKLNFCNESDDKIQKPKAINFENMSLSVYTTELKNIIDYFDKKYSEVILVGHSFGAIVSILFLDKYKKYRKNTKLVLWEPSLLPWKKKWMEKDFYYNGDEKLYREKRTGEFINKTFYKECVTTDSLKLFKLLNMKVYIIAVKNLAEKNAKKYFSKIRNKVDSKIFIMQKTGHSFEDIKSQKILFGKTLSFLNQK